MAVSSPRLTPTRGGTITDRAPPDAPVPRPQHRIPLHPELPTILDSYRLELTATEVDFLIEFLPYFIRTWNEPDDLQDLITLYATGRRLHPKLYPGEAVKVKLKAHELLALKRMLWSPSLSETIDLARVGLLGKIDQLTVGIF